MASEQLTMKTDSQLEMIKKHLQDGKSITPLEALRLYGCFRLSGRIYDLRHNDNMNIYGEIVNYNGSRFMKYTLIQVA